MFNIASALPQTAAPVVGATLLAVGSLQNQNCVQHRQRPAADRRPRRRCRAAGRRERTPELSLMLYVGALALIGALVVLPIKGVR